MVLFSRRLRFRKRLRLWLKAATFLGILSLCSAHVVGDMVELANGGRVRGRIVTVPVQPDPPQRSPAQSRPAPRPQSEHSAAPATILIETLTGGLVEIEADQAVQSLRRPIKWEQYEVRRQHTPDTLEGHWQLAEWCRRHKLEEPRKEHLRRVLQFDPDHTRAHYSLGHVRQGDRWLTQEQLDEAMRQKGYVKYKGRYVTRQELELLQQREAADKEARAWFPKVRLWYRWLKGRHAGRRAEALSSLQAISDPAAIRALKQFLGRDASPAVRRLLVKILGQIESPQAGGTLVAMALQDEDIGVRSAAVDALPESFHAQARARFRQALKSDRNETVLRAAAALRKIGTKEDVPALIAALVTSHRYRVRVRAGGGSYTFSRDGSFQLGGGPPTAVLPPEVDVALRTGQLPYGVIVQPDPLLVAQQPTRRVTVERKHKNQEVLWTLQKLTGQDFGFDTTAWEKWWLLQKAKAATVLNWE
ncbi:MAG: HEAT repeat domain-containing protein [Planctomycetes bacterium]|nr:HEAT repeat domain-containing protein [Planctomycetota bacterium]